MISSCSLYTSSKREIFTVWMKSLVINGNGCTVYNSEGEVVFRVDNYQTRRSSEVLLMNFYGEVLFSIKRKVLNSYYNMYIYELLATTILILWSTLINLLLYSVQKLLVFRSWEGHKWINSRLHKEGEWFKVKRKCKLFGRGIIACHVILGCNKTTASFYTILGLKRKSTLKIMDCEGQVLAEVN